MTSKKSNLAISWNKHVTEYQASGLTQAAYCRKHQLKVHKVIKKAVNPKTSLSKSDNGGDLRFFLVEAINCLLRFRFSAESFLTPPGDKIIR